MSNFGGRFGTELEVPVVEHLGHAGDLFRCQAVAGQRETACERVGQKNKRESLKTMLNWKALKEKLN